MKKQLLLLIALLVFPIAASLARSHHHHSHNKTAHIVQCVKPKALIWDVGGTTMTVDKMAMIKQIGLGEALAMFFKHGSGCVSLMKDTVFEFLEPQTQCDDPRYPCDPYGKLLPKLMVDWFMGDIQGCEILEKACAKAERYDFADKHHERITMRTLRWMFDPEVMANGMKPIRSSAKLLRDCAHVTDEYGHQLHSFHILSNWGDVSSFEIMMNKKSNQCIFKYFDPEHIHVSSVIHDIKPHASAFQYVLEHDHLKPEDCIFFDDQDDNLKAAEALGMTTIKVTKDNVHKIRKQLKELGVLPQK